MVDARCENTILVSKIVDDTFNGRLLTERCSHIAQPIMKDSAAKFQKNANLENDLCRYIVTSDICVAQLPFIMRLLNKNCKQAVSDQCQ